MSFAELFLIAVGLSMDAFAVSVCKGLSMKKASIKKAATIGLYFGIFQGIMPLIGYFAGSKLVDKIEAFDHWITFALLAAIGTKMIKESFGRHTAVTQETALSFDKMLPLAIATSIDALAVGVSFAFLNVKITSAALLICLTTLVISIAGVKIGNVFGDKFKSKAEFAGGLILILIGTKILLEHTGILL